MKPIEQARADLNASEAQGEHSEFMKHMGMVLDVATRLKKAMVARNLTRAKAKCPKCEKAGALQGWMLVGAAAGRHRRSGSAFRMFCETPGCQMEMME